MNKPNFSIEGRQAAVIKDIQRPWAFELTIPNISMIVDRKDLQLANGLVEEMTVRARNASIPERGVEMIESVFGGMKQFFPGKPTFGNTMAINFEESENQNVLKILYNWQQNIFDITKGHSNRLGKRPTNTPLSYATDMILSMKKYDGSFSDTIILFKNAMIQQVSAVDLEYTGSDSVKFNASFQYDYYFAQKFGEPIVTL